MEICGAVCGLNFPQAEVCTWIATLNPKFDRQL